MFDGVPAIFTPRKIMQQQPLLKLGSQFLRGKVKLKKSIGGVLNKPSKVEKIGNPT